MRKQTPQNPHLSLHAIRPADHKQRIIQNLQYALHFRGEVCVSRRVKQGYELSFGRPSSGSLSAQKHLRLLGEDCDSPAFLQIKCIQEGILMINASLFPNRPAAKEKALRKCCLSCIHMGKKAHDNRP